jgi:8-oxo-dGTP pyrophosphatase MutT (NUDIX family)
MMTGTGRTGTQSIPVDDSGLAALMLSGVQLKPAHASAAIILQGSRYLLQKRSMRADIFYPGHWGMFGGALDPGEDFEEGLRRELFEELAIEVRAVSYFTEFTFDLSGFGHGRVARQYFEVRIDEEELARIDQKEGDEMALFDAREIFATLRLVPYDTFAVWLHATQRPQQA